MAMRLAPLKRGRYHVGVEKWNERTVEWRG